MLYKIHVQETNLLNKFNVTLLQSEQICYSVLCVFSYTAAVSEQSKKRNSISKASSSSNGRQQQHQQNMQQQIAEVTAIAQTYKATHLDPFSRQH